MLFMLFLVLPALMLDMIEVKAKLALVLYLVLGMRWLWRVVHRFTQVGERVAAVAAVVVGWYMLFALLNMLNTMIFRF